MTAGKFFSMVVIASLLCIHLQAQPRNGKYAMAAEAEPVLKQILKGQTDELIAIRIQGLLLSEPLTLIATRYDTAFNQLAEKSYTAGERNTSFHSAHRFGAHIFLFTIQFDRGKKMAVLYGTQIDPATLEVVAKKELGRFDVVNRNNLPAIRILASADTSMILVFAEAPYTPYMESGPERLYVHVFDTNMNKQWSTVTDLPVDYRLMLFEAIELSNTGEVYLLCKQYRKGCVRERVRENKRWVPGYYYKVFVYRKNDPVPRQVMIDLQNKFVHAAALQFDGQEQLHLLGLYNDERHGSLEGSFNTVVHTDSSHQAITSWDSIAGGLSYLTKIIGTNKRTDGSIDLLTEIKDVERHDDTSGVIKKEELTYTARDIVVFNYKQDGRVLHTRIRKHQRALTTDAYISFKWMNKGDTLLLFYNDDEMELVVARINLQGELNRKLAGVARRYANITASQPFDQEAVILYTNQSRVFNNAKRRMLRWEP